MLGNRKIMGKNIKRLLEEKGITRQELSEKLNISYSTLSDWINGNTYPRIDSIERLANFFEVSKSDLVEEKHPHYLHDDTQALAEDLHKSDEYQILLDAPRKLSKKQLDALIDTIENMIKMNEDS